MPQHCTTPALDTSRKDYTALLGLKATQANKQSKPPPPPGFISLSIEHGVGGFESTTKRCSSKSKNYDHFFNIDWHYVVLRSLHEHDIQNPSAEWSSGMILA
uniref:MATH domain-containing protein n=1 Tax=Panagrellus redivivus TaxID=6233 RepID=A0A7E4VTF0_PANRE